jgi:hypothetical protein
MDQTGVAFSLNAPLWVQRASVERLSPFSLDSHAQQGRPFIMRFPTDDWKTTPSASALVASQHFGDDAATPPFGDARGIRPRPLANNPSQSGE